MISSFEYAVLTLPKIKQVIALVGAGILGDKYGHRILISSLGMLSAFIGMLLITCLSDKYNVGRLIGYYLTQAGAASFASLLSLIATNIAGYTKKTTVAALFLIGYCVGNIIGPQVFQDKDAPGYKPAKIVILVCDAVSLLDLFLIYWWCRRQNKKKAEARAHPGYVKIEGQEFYDLTDLENPEFVYHL